MLGRFLIVLSVVVLNVLFNVPVKSHEDQSGTLSDQVEDLESVKEYLPEALLNKTLNVGVYEEAPFAFRDEKTGSYQGISIDLWEVIAHKNGLSFTYFPVTQEEGINRVSTGKYDLLLGRIPDFPRKPGMKFEYTIPIYVSGIGIAYISKNSFEIIFNVIGSWGFFVVVLILLACLFLQAIIFWMLERKKNPEYKRGFWRGIGLGLWWSTGVVTSENVVDGQTKTLKGRIVAGFCMVASLIVMNILIASIISELTMGKLSSKIQEISDLKRLESVLCVQNTFGQQLLSKRYIPHRVVGTLKEGLMSLKNGKAQAVLYSEPVLKYVLHKDPIPNVKFMSLGFGVRYYSLIVQEESPFLRVINRDILDLMNSEEISEIIRKYMGNETSVITG